MACVFCEREKAHDDLCPLTFVDPKLASMVGVASSDWANALLKMLRSMPEDQHVDLITRAFMLLHRFANQKGMVEALERVHQHIDVGAAVGALKGSPKLTAEDTLFFHLNRAIENAKTELATGEKQV